MQFHQHTVLGMVLDSLVVGIKDKIAQGVEYDLIANSFVILHHMRMVTDHNVSAQFQVLTVLLSHAR